MHKKATALILSLSLISLNTNGLMAFALDNNYENQEINQEVNQNVDEELENNLDQEVNVTNDDKANTESNINNTTEDNTTMVSNSEELQNAINNAQAGDIIKVYPGEYTNTKITISNSNITLQGYTSSDQPITNVDNAISINSDISINGDNITIIGLETKNVYIGDIKKVNNTKVYNSYVVGILSIGHFSEGKSNNTLVEGCKVTSSLYAKSSNNIIRNTQANTIRVAANNTLVDNCTTDYLYLGDDKETKSNIKVSDTTVSSTMFIGFSYDMVSDVTIERVTSRYTDIGRRSGIASNINIIDSDLGRCAIGKEQRGKSNNVNINDSKIYTLNIGTSTGVAQNTKILNTNIIGEITIGSTDSTCENTFIETNNKTITDKGDNTLILNTLTSNLKKLRGQASSGMRIELIKDEITLVDKTITENKTIDEFLKEDNQDFSLLDGDNITIKVYNTSGILIFDQNFTIKNPKVTLATPSLEEVSNTSNRINGYFEPGSNVYILRENQSENDKDIITKSCDSTTGYFWYYVDSLATPLKQGEILRVYSKDNANNISEVIEVKVLDKKTPYIRLDNKLAVEDTTINGSAEVGCTVKAYVRASDQEPEKLIGESIVGNSGRFAIPIEVPLWNYAQITVKAIDDSSNVGMDFVTAIDEYTPEFKSVERITDKSTLIKGTVSEANALIKAQYVNGDYNNIIRDIGSVYSDKNGNFEITIPFELDASNQIMLVASDTANHYSERILKINRTINFTDINGHWAKDSILDFVNNGYISGYDDNTFRPNNQITRAEFVKIVNGVYGFTESTSIYFTDVPYHAWYAKDVAIAVKAGYINGKSETIFDPNAPITRQEAAKIISVIKNRQDYDYDKLDLFKDKDSISSWAKPYVEGVVEAGYMSGYDDNTFKPNQKITRAEAVVTLQRTLQ